MSWKLFFLIQEMHRFPNMTLFDKIDHTNMRIDQTTDIPNFDDY